MPDTEAGSTIKTSELFFKITATLLVLLIAIALTQLLVPGKQHWEIYLPMAIATLACAVVGIVSVIWES